MHLLTSANIRLVEYSGEEFENVISFDLSFVKSKCLGQGTIIYKGGAVVQKVIIIDISKATENKVTFFLEKIQN